MAEADSQKMTWEEARKVLGVAEDASDDTVRAAYLQQVRLHPPDRDPEAFERVRDANALLRNPALRAQRIFASPDPMAPLQTLLKDVQTPRRFVNAQLWLGVLKENRS